jgi:2-amino-4-hydroxy-6-hydroxymethyldihydropteridine diphosphokinase
VTGDETTGSGVENQIGSASIGQASGKATCYIGLGSNLGDRESLLRRACEGLAKDPHITILRGSSIFESEPWGYAEQPAFLNAVVEIDTELGPLELLLVLQSIEKRLGREKRFKWGPREIDLDLLLYADLQINRRGLTVPHPAMFERAFVLAPLAELAPWLTTRDGVPIQDALHRLDPHGKQAVVQAVSLMTVIC